jgi:hypothetical protein
MMFFVSDFRKMVPTIAIVKLQNICQLLTDSNIEYCIVGGTLLGCFRHGGFIPWDDDIDILVHENDMYKLANLFPDIFELVPTETITCSYHEGFRHFAVWRGAVHVDIWPWKSNNAQPHKIQTFIGYFDMHRWFPVRKARFADLIVSVPHDPIYVIEYNFGKQWRDTIKKTTSDKTIWLCNKNNVIEEAFTEQIPNIKDILIS